MKRPSQHVKEERIAAYSEILKLFPSATDMARELAIDKRGSIGQWRLRGVPVEYILILDMLGLISKEKLVPSIVNWETYSTKHEKTIRKKLNSMILVDTLKKTTSSTLQTVLKPVVEQLVNETLKRRAEDELTEEEQALL